MGWVGLDQSRREGVFVSCPGVGWMRSMIKIHTAVLGSMSTLLSQHDWDLCSILLSYAATRSKVSRRARAVNGNRHCDGQTCAHFPNILFEWQVLQWRANIRTLSNMRCKWQVLLWQANTSAVCMHHHRKTVPPSWFTDVRMHQICSIVSTCQCLSSNPHMYIPLTS